MRDVPTTLYLGASPTTSPGFRRSTISSSSSWPTSTHVIFDTTVPVLAKGKTDMARCRTYVRDDRPFAGPAPPAAVFYYSRDRRGEHPTSHLQGWAGVLQADAYSGYGELYAAQRQPAPVLEAACWAHARRKFFVLADIAASARRKARARRRR